jgi:hypothetical protein
MGGGEPSAGPSSRDLEGSPSAAGPSPTLGPPPGPVSHDMSWGASPRGSAFHVELQIVFFLDARGISWDDAWCKVRVCKRPRGCVALPASGPTCWGTRWRNDPGRRAARGLATECGPSASAPSAASKRSSPRRRERRRRRAASGASRPRTTRCGAWGFGPGRRTRCLPRRSGCEAHRVVALPRALPAPPHVPLLRARVREHRARATPPRGLQRADAGGEVNVVRGFNSGAAVGMAASMTFKAIADALRRRRERRNTQDAGPSCAPGAGGAEGKPPAEPSNPETCGRHRS